MKVQPRKCRTCPFRPRAAKKYRDVREIIALSAINEAGRICHSTGKDNLFHRDTGRPELICRGARDLQLAMFTAFGFLPEATDAAWNAKCHEEGIEPDSSLRKEDA